MPRAPIRHRRPVWCASAEGQVRRGLRTRLGRTIRTHPPASLIGKVGSMPFYIVHVSGSSTDKRTRVDPDTFDTYESAESVARARWPEQDYFVVEADDEAAAGRRALDDSRALDNWTS